MNNIIGYESIVGSLKLKGETLGNLGSPHFKRRAMGNLGSLTLKGGGYGGTLVPSL